MVEKNIHGYKVKYDDTDHALKQAVHHLEKLDGSEAGLYFQGARRDIIHHKAHFEFRDHNRHEDRNATLFHEGDGVYELRHREHGIFK